MIIIIVTLPDPRLLPATTQGRFLFACETWSWLMRDEASGDRGHGSVITGVSPWPLLHWPQIMRGATPVTDTFTTRCICRVFCSRWAWQMAGPKFGVQMMDSEYCSKTGERLQHCRTAAWRMGAADLSLLRPCFPSFVCQNRLIGPDSR